MKNVSTVRGEGLFDIGRGRCRVVLVLPVSCKEALRKHWKKDDWNTLRARIEGSPPHITVWLNEQKITDWRDTETCAAEGHIALQVHGGKRWVQGGFHRFRNIAVRELR